MYTPKQIDRFWNNVEVSECDACWPWKLSQHGNGYGQVGLRIDGHDRILKAHKVAWEIHNDAMLPPLSRTSHSCGNKLCCNPRHVIVQPSVALGDGLTPAARGEAHGMAQLTEAQVRLIKYRLNALTTREIADCFSMAFSTIWDIRKGITWRHV